jgi:excinuclease ABC subunit A
LRDGRSLTGKFLRGDLQIAAPAARRRGNGLALQVKGARAHNLKGIDVRIPLGTLTCVTGVSGSGKSTLVHDVICAALLRRRGRWDQPVGEHDALEGATHVEDVVLVDQSPIGRTPRSNPATYLKAFDGIRELFAATRDARGRGLKAAQFSFNVPGGRCETCSGEGFVAVELLFLPGTYAPCPTCHGARYEPETLEIRVRGKSIADVLGMTVDEAAGFLADLPAAMRSLETLREVGLGYLRLGQPLTTLSGGERQRLKLATHMGEEGGIYVLDELTTGLHLADLEQLLGLLDRLVDSGKSVIVVEHHQAVMAHADWIIDLGPGAGHDGGRIVFEGTPAALVKARSTLTGQHLAVFVGGA